MKEIKLSNGQVVKMREPKVKDMKLVKDVEDDFEREIKLIVNLTEMTPEEVENLSMKDFNKLDKALQDFLF
ncbi:phage tail assembly protein [Hydrogenimonas thermophila]|uniref:phage tail assembly protein n=1 Tax=Hydrogenimonas thermophila TaxID=223786 RepID=UPI0029370FE4|nr:phage tail assembly protein [Hydrogenimonas thermophila]WOE69081.1 phage tail assembly protein [Hydrogenimonas thermophila]WOE71591.1 phage tail assembly protein [Hydrogenimonas thermophila]